MLMSLAMPMSKLELKSQKLEWIDVLNLYKWQNPAKTAYAGIQHSRIMFLAQISQRGHYKLCPCPT